MRKEVINRPLDLWVAPDTEIDIPKTDPLWYPIPPQQYCLRSQLPRIIHRDLTRMSEGQQTILRKFGGNPTEFSAGTDSLLSCSPRCGSTCLVAYVGKCIELANLETLDDFAVPCPHIEETKIKFERMQR